MKEPETLKELLEEIVRQVRLDNDEGVIITLTHGDGLHELIEDIEKHIAHPTAQPTEETCKWSYAFYGAAMHNPHNGCRYSLFQLDYCPTCGKRIEVVE